MPKCEICGKEYGIINNNHLRTHGMTLPEYVEKYGDPNAGAFTSEQRGASPKKVKEKLAKPKKALSHQAAKTVDDLYELDRTIQVPKRFVSIMSPNVHELEQMIKEIHLFGRFSIDLETTGLSPFEDLITDIIITPYGDTVGRSYNIPLLHIKKSYQYLDHDTIMSIFKNGSTTFENGYITLENLLEPGQLPRAWIFDKLRPILESEHLKKTLFNNYFDELMLWGGPKINMRGVEWDALIAAHILNENEPSHKLKDLYRKYLHEKEDDMEIKMLGVDTYEEQFGKIRFYRVPMNVATAYACKDGHMTAKMRLFQQPYIDTVGNLKEVFYNIEMPLQPILIDMRKEGIAVDLEFAKSLEIRMKADREETHKRITELIGDVNLNSPKQLSHALFDELKLPRIDKDSTKAAVLEQLADEGYEIADLLLDYKKSEKLIGTYLEGLEFIVAKATGRIHCRFNQNGTKTGRFSSSDPNLQNIPAKNKYIRKIFKAKAGYSLISCDFSQIEPRLLAHIADDPGMISAYKEGKDIYSTMAAFVFTLVAKGFSDKLNAVEATVEDLAHYASPVYKYILENNFVGLGNDGNWYYKEITIDDCYDGSLFRKYMKTLLLGMMYSMSEMGLASRLKISKEDALEIMNYFFKAFPNIKKAMTYFQRYCKEEGYVETPVGRKRRLPDIWDEQWFIRKKAERQVLNSVIQGYAADVMKLAMIAVGQDERIKALGGKMLLTVHDELILEAPKENSVAITKYVIEDMISVVDLKVPLKVDGEIFIDGRWYGESIAVKNKGGNWKIIESYEEFDEEQGKKVQKSREIQEDEIQWAV